MKRILSPTAYDLNDVIISHDTYPIPTGQGWPGHAHSPFGPHHSTNVPLHMRPTQSRATGSPMLVNSTILGFAARAHPLENVTALPTIMQAPATYLAMYPATPDDDTR